jgi:predicted AAA+ superfamily ATPase
MSESIINRGGTPEASIFTYRANTAFRRPALQTLLARLQESPRRMIVVAGPRQIGKSTLVAQALDGRIASFVATDAAGTANSDPLALDPYASGSTGTSGIAVTTMTNYATNHATNTTRASVGDAQWLIQCWNQARAVARGLPHGQQYTLAIDEIQKIPRWSEVVKGLWDQDRRDDLPLHIILLGSSPWLLQKGLTESLAGRYEPIFMSHWSYREMREAFDMTLEQYIYFGGYPEPATTRHDENRFKRYVLSALINATIDQDLLQMTRVEKPAVLKRLFELGCGTYSGQIMAFHKIVEDLGDGAHIVTLRHYLDLLSQAKMLTGLQKFAGQEIRRRASPPKFNTHNTALICAQLTTTFEQAKNSPELWGHLVESAVGAHLINELPINCGLYYWRAEPFEVDFVLVAGRKVVAIEVKSSAKFKKPKGLEAFKSKFANNYDIKTLLIGPGLPTVTAGTDSSVSLEEFLLWPVEHWIQD